MYKSEYFNIFHYLILCNDDFDEKLTVTQAVGLHRSLGDEAWGPVDRFVPRDDENLGRDATQTPVTARSAATRQSMDRFVPRDDGRVPRDATQTPVTARRAATWQSMDRFVPRDDGKTTVTARRLATWQSMDRFVPRDDT